MIKASRMFRKKTKVLETNRCVFAWISAFPPDVCANKWKRIAYVIATLAILLDFVVGNCASVAFFLDHVSTDLGQASFAVVQIFTMCMCIYTILVLVVSRQKLFGVYKRLVEIYDESKNTF